MKKITKIEYSAFIPEGSRPKDPRIAAMVGAPAGTIEKGIIEESGLWRREGYHGKFEKKLKAPINVLFSDIQNVLDGKKAQPKYFNTAVGVKEMTIYYDGGTLKLSYEVNQEQYLKVQNILEKAIKQNWKIGW